MIAGSLVLGSAQRSAAIDFGTPNVKGSLAAQNCGMWSVVTTLPRDLLHIPSRDKMIELFANSDDLRADLATIDSDYGPNYKTKLAHAADGLPPSFQALLINHSTSSHTSLALITKSRPIHVWGLYEQSSARATLVFHTDLGQLQQHLMVNPLTYLVHRFPPLVNDCLFLPVETVCAKWWRWARNADGNPLRSFNALERRLYGHVY